MALWIAPDGLSPAEFDKYVAQGYILKILDDYIVAGKDAATLWQKDTSCTKMENIQRSWLSFSFFSCS